MPGVLILESMAQTSGVLILHEIPDRDKKLLYFAGIDKAQDQVDAKNSLSDSKNQRTQALVTHTIARLQFWDNLGILYIKDNGRWEDTKDAKGN
jgi:3-hydroxymyristoyl/3-hydroxydecanoyl-(acyl carrier protein) dehydratase